MGISTGGQGPNGLSSMRQFNYNVQMNANSQKAAAGLPKISVNNGAAGGDQEFDQADLDELEREIEQVIRCGTADAPRPQFGPAHTNSFGMDRNIINVTVGNNNLNITNEY